VKDLNKPYRNLQLDAFLKAQGVNDDLVSLADPRVFQALDGMVGSVKPEAWKAYLRWRVGDAMAPYLSSGFRDASFGFRGRCCRACRNRRRAGSRRWTPSTWPPARCSAASTPTAT
jgi:predicted metalloendopeptidase